MGKTLAARATAQALVKHDPESLREALLEDVAADWLRGIASAVRGDGAWRGPRYDGGPVVDRPQRWAFRLVAEVAKLVGMPQQQLLLVLEREVGADLKQAKLAVELWRDAQGLTDEGKREVAEEWLSRHHGVPVGALRDAIAAAKRSRVPLAEEVK